MWNLKRNDADELTKQKETHKLRNKLMVAEGWWVGEDGGKG